MKIVEIRSDRQVENELWARASREIIGLVDTQILEQLWKSVNDRISRHINAQLEEEFPEE